MKPTKILALLLALLMLVSSFAACGGPVEEPDTTVPDDTTAAVTKLFMRKGDTVEYWWSFDVPEDFPAGTYTVTVAWFGSEQTPEGVEFVMTESLEVPVQAE